MIKLFLILRGKFWLKMGYCPYCYSSPPKKECPVCAGSYGYHYMLTPKRRKEWEENYKKFLEVLY